MKLCLAPSEHCDPLLYHVRKHQALKTGTRHNQCLISADTKVTQTVVSSQTQNYSSLANDAHLNVNSTSTESDLSSSR